MNKTERKKVEKWIETLSNIQSEIETMQESEQEKYDNMPEGLQYSKRGQAIDEAAYNLEEAASNVESAIDNLKEI